MEHIEKLLTEQKKQLAEMSVLLEKLVKLNTPAVPKQARRALKGWAHD